MCSCTAGMSHTCNHVIAVLYKVEFAISKHLNSESCTDKSCEWNKSMKRTIEPKKVEDMGLCAHSARKQLKITETTSERENRKSFDPRRPGENFKKSSEVTSFLEGLAKAAPKCVLFTGMAAQLQCKPTRKLPPTMEQAADHCISKHSHLNGSDISEKLGESLILSKDQCDMLEEKTREQGAVWRDHRKGRITGSNVKRVVRKVEELNRNRNAATTSLTYHLITGGQDLSHVQAIQWGKDQEHNALLEFKSVMSQKHINCHLRKAGLYVKDKLSYIGASPDAIMFYDCHGYSTVEVKCPFRLKGLDIESNYHLTDFLYKLESDIRLKEDHEYHYQVQTQLAVTNFQNGYFCVSSLNGNRLIINVMRDEQLWDSIEQKLVLFFKGYVSKYLLRFKEFSFCPACDKLCLEPRECKKEGDNSVCCDLCNLWYHWTCVEYINEQQNFSCELCTEDITSIPDMD